MTGPDALLAISALVLVACIIAAAVIFGGIREANAALNDDATDGADWGGEASFHRGNE
jgi:hypothetical protein